MADIIIIGAGIAGLSAAIYSKRAGMDTLVFENAMYGGQIVTSPKIVNYPGIRETSGVQLAMTLFEQVSSLGVTVNNDKVLDIIKNDDNRGDNEEFLWIVKTNKGDYYAKAVIIATGLVHRELDLEKAELFKGKGISYCATCDGAFYKDKNVVVYGGGNTAVTDAIFLAQYCTNVYLVHRRNNFRAQKGLVDSLEEYDNIHTVMDSVITDIEGDDQGMLSAVITKDSKNNSKKIDAQGLFVAIGQQPVNDYFKKTVDVNESGYIVAGEDCRTNVEGIFAAGDCRTKKVRQLITAACDGAVAAIGAIEQITIQEK